ncbi:uncharacterized protein LOC128252111 [Drosophila gunungcola]|uniref:Uncharacterized protein n=1 Tax=Drosophila gunungcola TaxID=103775 RepID=A0A9P9YXD5_9MUSC|nr:uncharacterized protein LOC128252111 [Drosophila gunungcola]KAI8044862.1 hypothetical protein M5D96_001037 [Drosophila gunungcola]
MSEKEEESIAYLTEKGIFPRLLEILKQMVETDPMPADPLMYILHLLGCPLIPQAQMKALERKVSRAHEELRYLRRVIIDLDGDDQLYDSESDVEEYVGDVEDTSLSATEISLAESTECPAEDSSQLEFLAQSSSSSSKDSDSSHQ